MRGLPGPEETPNRKKEAQTDSQGRQNKKKGGRERGMARKTGNKMNNKNKLQLQGLNVPS